MIRASYVQASGEQGGQTVQGTCAGSGCDRPAKVKGMCQKHYVSAKRAEERAARPPKEPTVRLCSVPGCGKRHKGQGFCATHYRHWYREQHARVPAPKPAPRSAEPEPGAAEAVERALATIQCASPEAVHIWLGDGQSVYASLKTGASTTADRMFCHDAAGARHWCERQRASGRCIRSDAEYKFIVSCDRD